jgi:hypothetical protein
MYPNDILSIRNEDAYNSLVLSAYAWLLSGIITGVFIAALGWRVQIMQEIRDDMNDMRRYVKNIDNNILVQTKAIEEYIKKKANS